MTHHLIAPCDDCGNTRPVRWVRTDNPAYSTGIKTFEELYEESVAAGSPALPVAHSPCLDFALCDNCLFIRGLRARPPQTETRDE